MFRSTLLILSSLFLFVLQCRGQYYNFNHNSLKRQFILYTPEDLPANAPLVFVLHGYSGDAHSIRDYTKMNMVADQNNFAVCYPQGTKDQWGNRFWNVGYEFHEDTGIDDVGFVSGLADFLQTKYNLSPTKTFATGMSNGADMSFLLACEAHEVFRAVAPVCGTIMTIKFDSCTHPVPVLAISGTNDNTTWYTGDPKNIGEWGPYLSVPEIIERFVENNNCDKSSAESLRPK